MTGELICATHAVPSTSSTRPIQREPGAGGQLQNGHGEQQKAQDFLAMIERMQGTRLEDQRCAMPVQVLVSRGIYRIRLGVAESGEIAPSDAINHTK